jgi:uncharacterized protein YheU (UPF0270 family)
MDDKTQEIVHVPHSELAPDVLRGVVESFVLREGTDYGERELSLDQKVEHVMRQLRRGEAQIIFDSDSQTVDVVTTAALQRKP